MTRKNKSFFWASYADLMTSMFFVMLMLFVVAVVLLNNEKGRIEGEYTVIKAQLDKAKEIENATKGLDPEYFEYKEAFKKHKLKVDVQFPPREYNITYVNEETQKTLLDAGLSAKKFVDETTKKFPGIQYLLIIEGQASKDSYPENYELSYKRALALKRYWDNNGIQFTDKNCEVLICGSGDGKLSGTGLMREVGDEKLNQRFLIHLLPKPGMIQ